MTTQQDLERVVRQAVQTALTTHDACSRFTNEEVVMIKRRLKAVDKVANTIGYAIIIAFTGFFLTLVKFGWTIWAKGDPQ